jgi:hypothetical protein
VGWRSHDHSSPLTLHILPLDHHADQRHLALLPLGQMAYFKQCPGLTVCILARVQRMGNDLLPAHRPPFSPDLAPALGIELAACSSNRPRI